ncbi:hypothetical protein JKP88DRAFT_260237 [Tribonema minus]|uniref:Uncharacterized protein n=1 Tax=Tribonema minus TaxID=303371 RepID=A0A836CIZ0_9STRA|nr:hypothetical protein JKP88DRAFT_260237 [Tribonema minus]
MSNLSFSSVARTESSLLEELKRREVFGMPPPPNGNRNPDFEPNLGKVIDTLRSDYPELLNEPLDYSIYTDDITVKDPSGVEFKGIGTYKRLFATLRFFRHTFVDTVDTRFRVTYDWARQRVRVNWHMALSFKARAGHPVFVDCISVYHINDEGFVSAHDLETIMVNGEGFASAYDLQAMMGLWVRSEKGVGAAAAATTTAMSAATTALSAAATATSLSTAATAVASAATGTLAAALRGDSSGGGDAGKDRSKAPRLAWPKVDLPSGCEDSWDCESPMTCCDFALFKVCCNQGMGSPVTEPRLVPIPIPVEDYPQYPPRYPDYY